MNDEAAPPAPVKSRELRAGLVIAGGLAVVALVVLAIALAAQTRALTYTLYFDDARGLKTGDRVMLGGVSIGVVKEIRLQTQPTRIDVDVRINPKYADKVLLGSTAKIKDRSWPNVSGQMIVEILNPPGDEPSPPMEKDAEIPGLNSVGDEVKWKIKHKFSDLPGNFLEMREAIAEKTGDFKRSLGEKAGDLKTQYEAVKNDPRVIAAIEKLMAFLDEMKEKGVAGARQLKEKWPAIKEQMGPAYEVLKQYGADRLKIRLERMVEDVDRTLDLWETLLEQGEKVNGKTPAETEDVD